MAYVRLFHTVTCQGTPLWEGFEPKKAIIGGAHFRPKVNGGGGGGGLAWHGTYVSICASHPAIPVRISVLLSLRMTSNE